MKLFKKEFSKPLSNIINLSFNKGIFPNLLKIANVIPIYKKDDKLDYNNYRPISLLSNISKIYEKCMHMRLTNFCRMNKLFFSHQFGFRNGYSTNYAFTSLTEMIRKALDEDKFDYGVFIDLQKAFDTVEHSILLSKLNHYGVRGASYQWFKSYLTGRQQYTTIAHQTSDLCNMNYGVLQDSVLGPLLFLLYIDDLNQAILHFKVHHFADDTNFLYASHSLKKLNKTINCDLSNLVQWLRKNKISLNVSKTELIIFRSSKKKKKKKSKFLTKWVKDRTKTSHKVLRSNSR